MNTIMRIKVLRPAVIQNFERGCFRGWLWRHHRHNFDRETHDKFHRDIKEFKENMKQLSEDFKDRMKENYKYGYMGKYSHGDFSPYDWSQWFGRSETGTSTRSPVTRVEEQADCFLVEVEVPGFKKEDIKITFSKDTLIIATKESAPAQSKEETTTASGESPKTKKSFYREIQFNEPIQNEIVAKIEDGILFVRIPKDKVDFEVNIQ